MMNRPQQSSPSCGRLVTCLDATGDAGGGEVLIVAVEGGGRHHVWGLQQVAVLERRLHLQQCTATLSGLLVPINMCRDAVWHRATPIVGSFFPIMSDPAQGLGSAGLPAAYMPIKGQLSRQQAMSSESLSRVRDASYPNYDC